MQREDQQPEPLDTDYCYLRIDVGGAIKSAQLTALADILDRESAIPLVGSESVCEELLVAKNEERIASFCLRSESDQILHQIYKLVKDSKLAFAYHCAEHGLDNSVSEYAGIWTPEDGEISYEAINGVAFIPQDHIVGQKDCDNLIKVQQRAIPALVHIKESQLEPNVPAQPAFTKTYPSLGRAM
ncbi:hypothetical protein ACQU0X_26580 [Pseudovibrio ascidiaceicola]|uniref:hypothetical protein n=1 Tax=Pseudovibrio ascidiaceicola TaxID=285279 RepID=UPI003D35ACEE